MKRSNRVQTRAQQYILVLLHRITPRALASAKTDWDWIRRLSASAPYAQHRPPLSFDYARNTVRSTGYAQSTEYGRQTPSIILLFPNGDLSEEEKTKKKKRNHIHLILYFCWATIITIQIIIIIIITTFAAKVWVFLLDQRTFYSKSFPAKQTEQF